MSTQTLPSPSKPRWSRDVFLSFRGEDTRKNFTDHLYTALVQAGIHTFRDDDELPRGKDISTELLKAIRESRISIVVFSKDYASSRWCLDELVEILHCKNTMGHILLPVFYDVNPSDVRKQTGILAEAFAKHEERFQAEKERVQKWRAALTEAANYSGWDLQNVANGYESMFIKKIVEEVLCKVNRAYLSIATYPVGIESRVDKLKALLSLGTSDVRIVGIYGMGGIGKTTIAKAVYNQLRDGFEGNSCLLDIKETAKQPDGVVRLQEQLLSEILEKKNFKVGNAPRGINLIKERVHCKKVLVILDDVDHVEQLNSLAGSLEWFGSGSRVIVTTRDEHLLYQLGVHGKYKVDELDYEESLELFSWHAFRMTHPIEDYLDLAIDMVNYLGGLPLALEVLGSYVRGRSIIEWKSAAEKLKKIPDHQIQKILRISFDSLDDDTVKKIFLDIACFFIGLDKEYVVKIFDGCDFFPIIGISILIQRSLVTIDDENELRMHDLIRDMGREIVREMSPGDPGKRSRLWFQEDVLNVLSKHTGSEAVEGLVLSLPVLEDVHLKTETFRKMKYLRLLQIDSVHLAGCYEDLSQELRWLCWHNCPLKFLPPNFYLNSIVVLDMQKSHLKELWRGKKELNRLKVLNLSYSKYLTTSPNFLQVQSLEILILEGCTSLVEVHDSIEHLEGLVLLNLEGCKSLRNLPRNISNLKSLETLKLTGCLKLDKLPEEIGNMAALRELLADGTAIKQLPPSIVFLKNLETLSFSGCEDQSSKSLFSRFSSWVLSKSNPTNMLPASVSGLCSLRTLTLSDCSLSEDGIPSDIGSLSSLIHLDLTGNNFRNLPHGISCLPKLENLILEFCTSLQSISGLPESLTALYAADCGSLERISNLSSRHSSYFILTNCHKLMEIQGLDTSNSSQVVHMESCNNLSYDFRKSLIEGLSKADQPCAIFLPGSEVPNWFSHQAIGSSIFFHVPSLAVGEIQGLLICAVYAAKDENKATASAPFAIVNNKTRGHQETFRPTFRPVPETCEDHYCVCHIPLKSYGFEMESEEEIEVSIRAGHAIEVSKCGVHLLLEPNTINAYRSSLVEYSHSDTAAEGAPDLICVKRGRDDNEAGRSNETVENCSKRLRLESEAQE